MGAWGHLIRLVIPVIIVFLGLRGFSLFQNVKSNKMPLPEQHTDGIILNGESNPVDVRVNLYQRNITMSTKLELIKKLVSKLEDEWVYKQERNQWEKVDANYYQGEKNQHGQRHGLGVVSLPNGDFFMGQWQFDNRHGYGKTIVGWSFSETTEEYISEWRFDEPHGIGLYHTGDGLKYEGEWKSGRQDGFGVFAWPDGSRYIGEWMDGKQHGHGIWENTVVIHEGFWKEGKRTAKLTHKKDGQVLYKMYNDDELVE